jgi:transcriptional regulator with AAA-type ATPase domain
LLARYIHFHTDGTAKGEFIEENFAAMPEQLIDSLLRGTEKGVATNVLESKGILRIANRGSLFIDEISEVSKRIQAKLLKLISERVEPIRYRRIGGEKAEESLVRFIAATNISESMLFEKIRPDLLSRFTLRIKLKDLNKKTPDPFRFYLSAIKHYSSYDLRYNPLLIPEWDAKALKILYDNNRLPTTLRELRSFVYRVWDRRRGPNNPRWTTGVVTKDEIDAALYTKPHVVDIKTDNLSLLKNMAQNLSKYVNESQLNELSTEDAKELVFLVKKLALEIAKMHSPKKTKAMEIYGRSNIYSFNELLDNPLKLHPDKEKRQKNYKSI